MIVRQIKGKSFRGVLNYLEREQSLIIGGNMGGKTPRELSAEFAVSRQLNPRLSKAVYHSSLSLPKSDRLDQDGWNEIADDYMKGMGFEDSQYVVYRHSDTKHDHIHIVASRIRITDGTTVSDSWDYVKSKKLIKELEQKYELTPTISLKQSLRREQTTGEQRLIERTGEESVRLKLQSAIDEQINLPITMPELVNRLKNQGIDAKISITRTGKIKGISYKLDGIAFSGTKLGRGYTFPGLQKHRQVSYDHNLHYEQLIEASNTEPVVKTVENEEIELAQRQETQRERTREIAPILASYINYEKKAEIETKNYRISWQREEKTLYLYRKEESEPILKAKYQNQSFEPLQPAEGATHQPRLTNTDIDRFQRFAPQLRRAIKQRQLEQEQKTIKRERSI